MALWASRKRWLGLATGWLGLLLLGSAGGCGQGGGGAAPAGDTDQKSPQLVVVPSRVVGGGAVPSAKAKTRPVASDPRLHQPFLDAVSLEPPEDQARPPDVTLAGLSVGKLYKAIVGNRGKGGLWEQVQFVSDSGQKLRYTATIKTDQGDMEMELYPEVAPNHVRNFVALARAGYYKGLQFNRASAEALPTDPKQVHEYIEGGCPLGTGEASSGSIGYWLRPEFSTKVHHEPGTVGASRGEDEESAGCKFYIALNRAAWLDGQYTIFGKITRNLGVARKIFDRPRGEDGTGGLLQNPVTIRQVLIHVHEVEGATHH